MEHDDLHSLLLDRKRILDLALGEEAGRTGASGYPVKGELTS
jgi:hypothetical protein